MKWKQACMSPSKAQSVKDSFEYGDYLGLEELDRWFERREEPLNKDERLLRHLVAAAWSLNAMVIDMEQDDIDFDLELDTVYRTIIMTIFEYLDATINLEV